MSGLDEAAAELAKIVDDKSATHRPEALADLANLKRPGCLAPVLRALDDSNQEVVKAAIQAAVALGDPQALPALRKLASEATNAEVQKAAQEALAKLSQPNQAPPALPAQKSSGLREGKGLTHDERALLCPNT